MLFRSTAAVLIDFVPRRSQNVSTAPAGRNLCRLAESNESKLRQERHKGRCRSYGACDSVLVDDLQGCRTDGGEFSLEHCAKGRIAPPQRSVKFAGWARPRRPLPHKGLHSVAVQVGRCEFSPVPDVERLPLWTVVEHDQDVSFIRCLEGDVEERRHRVRGNEIGRAHV